MYLVFVFVTSFTRKNFAKLSFAICSFSYFAVRRPRLAPVRAHDHSFSVSIVCFMWVPLDRVACTRCRSDTPNFFKVFVGPSRSGVSARCFSLFAPGVVLPRARLDVSFAVGCCLLSLICTGRTGVSQAAFSFVSLGSDSSVANEAPVPLPSRKRLQFRVKVLSREYCRYKMPVRSEQTQRPSTVARSFLCCRQVLVAVAGSFLQLRRHVSQPRPRPCLCHVHVNACWLRAKPCPQVVHNS